MNSHYEKSRAARVAGDAFFDALVDLSAVTCQRKVSGEDVREEWDAAMHKVLAAQEEALRKAGLDVSDTRAVSDFLVAVSIIREARTGKSLREEARERTWKTRTRSRR